MTPGGDDLYQDPRTGSRTPDFVAASQRGVIYTSGSNLAEHGGFSTDDRNVALLVSAPSLPGTIDENLVETRQIAPTILTAPGLDPARLIGVRQEGTQALPIPRPSEASAPQRRCHGPAARVFRPRNRPDELAFSIFIRLECISVSIGVGMLPRETAP